MHCQGIEPWAIAWKANMLPLHQQCLSKYLKKDKQKKALGGTRTRNFQIRSLTRYPIASQGHYKKRSVLGSNQWPCG